MFTVRKINESYVNSHSYYQLIRWLTEYERIDQFIANTSVEQLHKLNCEDYKEYAPTTLLRIAFNYEQSPEGFEYWTKVTDRLKIDEENINN